MEYVFVQVFQPMTWEEVGKLVVMSHLVPQVSNSGQQLKKIDLFIIDLEEDQECDAQKCIIADSDDQSPIWIGCNCGLWFHLFCINLVEPIDNFLCDNCV